jgi:predicted AlkP superfamily pyrophosphatase or phosphodiesterase
MVTGVSAWEHGIVSNNQPGKPGQRWWYVEFLKSKTLWELAGEKGLKTAAVWWPVTARGKIDFNLPEFWDDASVKPYAFAPVAREATPGLVEKIRGIDPAFGGKDFSDEQGAIAVRVLLETERPELTLWHLGELDSAQHETGAFSEHAKEILEHQDELLAKVLKVLPQGSYVALVSDHGFETEERQLRPEVLLRQAGITSKVEVAEGLFGVSEQAGADYFRALIGKPDSTIAREVPIGDVHRLAPSLKHWTAAFEPVHGVMAVKGTEGPAISQTGGRGDHGLWPTRQDYRASFVLWGPGIKPQVLPEIPMLDIAPTLADLLGVKLPRVEGKSLWDQLQ